MTVPETKESVLPEYDNPPLNEVVCGLLFKSLDLMLAPHLGVLWEAFKKEYPTCQEVPPIIPIIESFERRLGHAPEITEIPPLSRIWFVHANGNGIIQVQRDRFLHNWRKINRSDSYPRFEHILSMFWSHLSTFTKFIETNKLGIIEPLQYEVTYVNHIYQGEGWRTNEDAGNVFADFEWRKTNGRFLPAPEAINWRTSFVLPNKAGRLHVAIKNGESREDGRRLYILELTARGFTTETKSIDGMRDWFKLAHEWIVCGFADFTNERTQKEIWKRTR